MRIFNNKIGKGLTVLAAVSKSGTANMSKPLHFINSFASACMLPTVYMLMICSTFHVSLLIIL